MILGLCIAAIAIGTLLSSSGRYTPLGAIDTKLPVCVSVLKLMVLAFGKRQRLLIFLPKCLPSCEFLLVLFLGYIGCDFFPFLFISYFRHYLCLFKLRLNRSIGRR